MGKELRVAILGGGAGAQTTAADLTFRGHCVNIYQLPSFREEFAHVLERRGVEIVGKKKEGKEVFGAKRIGFAKVNKATVEIEEAMEEVSLVMIIVPAFAQRAFIDACSPFLEDGQVLLLSPGRTGGALLAEKALYENAVEADVLIAETASLFYATRIVGPAQTTIYADKVCLYTSVLPANRTHEAMKIINQAYPEFVSLSSVLATSFYNIGCVLHPAPAVLNAGRIEWTKGDFKFYPEGMTPSVVRVMEEVEKERVSLCEALGLKPMGIIEILNEYYGNLYPPSYSLYDLVHNSEVYAQANGPDSMTHRFISEEIPNTMVPMSFMGKALGMPTPVMDMIIDIANIMNQCNYRREGRTLEKIGLNGMGLQEMKKRVGL